MSRPAVDVVIPFAGKAADLAELVAALEQVELRTGDRILVADNRPAGTPIGAAGRATVEIVPVRDVRSSYHARNRAAAAGEADWILFIDSDVEWSAGLLDAYFDPQPGERTAVLAGAIEDAPLEPGRRATLAERYAVARRSMAAENTLDVIGRPPYAQTANCMVRRATFDAVSGFADDIRSGGDADLCFRLQAAGWELERRTGAAAVHRNRRTLSAVMAQKARHGAGAAWLDRQHPGTFPRRRLLGLAVWSAREGWTALGFGHGSADRGAAVAIVDLVAVWAFELGRLLPNRARRGGGR